MNILDALRAHSDFTARRRGNRTCTILGALLPALLTLGGAARAQNRPPAKPAVESEETAAAKLTQKLQAIVIPKLEFRDATVSEVVDCLRMRSGCEPGTDPEKRDVNFVLNLSAAPESAPPRLTFSLSNIPLLEALKYMTSLANLKFKVERSAVVIVPVGTKTNSAPALPARGVPGTPEQFAREKIARKLNSIILPRIEFRDATLREAVDFLMKKSADLETAEPDLARRGLSVVLKAPSTVGDSGEKRVTLSLKNVSLADAFKYTTELAGCQMRIEPYALTITPLEAK